MRDLIVCPACTLDDDVCSIVRLVESSCTELPVDEFWDEDGDYHIHDLALKHYTFGCSRGHVWEESEPRPICWCEDDRAPTWREREAMAHDAAE